MEATYYVSVSLLCVSAGEVVPLLNTVLGRMIPMLGATKQDNMQWVFAYGKTEAILSLPDAAALSLSLSLSL